MTPHSVVMQLLYGIETTPRAIITESPGAESARQAVSTGVDRCACAMMVLMPKHPADLHLPEGIRVPHSILANPTNVAILKYLAGVPSGNYGDIQDNLADLAAAQGVTPPSATTVSRRLQALEEDGAISADLAKGRRRGRSVNYSVDRAKLKQIFDEFSSWILEQS